MFFIEKNRRINRIEDLKVFAQAKDIELVTEVNGPDHPLIARLELTGLVNRRTVESRTYLVYLDEVPGGYVATHTKRVK